MEKRFFNSKEVANYLGLSESTIRSWVKNGQIPFHHLGRCVRFDIRKIDKWLEKKQCYVRKKGSQGFRLQNY